MLAPLQRITGAARAATGGSLSHRVRLPGRQDQFRELADAFDGMLERLEAHVAEQQRFAANASHELRTPLAVTRTTLEVARRDPHRDVEDVLARLEAVNTRAIDLTEALLLLARADQRPPGRTPVDLSLAAEEAAETLLPLAEERGTTVEVAGGRATAVGSPALLLQVVTNLVHNAVVHNLPAGGTVRVLTAAGPEHVTLTVESTGEHLDPAVLGTLTEPFQRGAGRVRTDAAGVGLGLAIVERVVRAHDGDLSLRARPGGGLVVTVRLPAAPDADDEPGPPPRQGGIDGPWLLPGAGDGRERPMTTAAAHDDRTGQGSPGEPSACGAGRRCSRRSSGCPAGQRRRTEGLRREEVAVLCGMSADYYARIERQRGPHPSEQMVGAIAQGMHLGLEERDHLFRLAGHTPPPRGAQRPHQPRPDADPRPARRRPGQGGHRSSARRCGKPRSGWPCGVTTRLTGPARSRGYRWSPNPRTAPLPARGPRHMSRVRRRACGRWPRCAGRARPPPGSPKWSSPQSEEFREIWADHEIGSDPRRQALRAPRGRRPRAALPAPADPQQSHGLLVYTAVPGTESHEKLQMLSVLGAYAAT